jgi:hypothetical protein
MSLKITVEVDGQSEQQLAPLIAQWASRHPEWLGLGAQQNAPELSASRDFYHENSALLQQQIQQLTAQNELLQAQVTHSQRLLAGVPQAKALLPAALDSQRAASSVAVSPFSKEAPPLLPVQYQLRRGEILVYRLKRLPAQLWQSLVWLTLGREWLLLFLLLCGGLYGALSIAPKLADQIWPEPEFVDSADGGPGAAKTTAPATERKTADQAEEKKLPTSPSSKAGSHPPPPPAFRQQP